MVPNSIQPINIDELVSEANNNFFGVIIDFSLLTISYNNLQSKARRFIGKNVDITVSPQPRGAVSLDIITSLHSMQDRYNVSDLQGLSIVLRVRDKDTFEKLEIYHTNLSYKIRENCSSGIFYNVPYGFYSLQLLNPLDC